MELLLLLVLLLRCIVFDGCVCVVVRLCDCGVCCVGGALCVRCAGGGAPVDKIVTAPTACSGAAVSTARLEAVDTCDRLHLRLLQWRRVRLCGCIVVVTVTLAFGTAACALVAGTRRTCADLRQCWCATAADAATVAARAAIVAALGWVAGNCSSSISSCSSSLSGSVCTPALSPMRTRAPVTSLSGASRSNPSCANSACVYLGTSLTQ